MNYVDLAQKLIDDNVFMRDAMWSPETLAVWLQGGANCVYCGIHFLTNRSIMYGLPQIDHLLPRNLYPKLEHEVSNQVLCCHTCNSAKRQWDPNNDAHVYAGEQVLSDEQRLALVAAVKSMFEVRDAHKHERYMKEKALIEREIQRLGSLTATASAGR